MVMMVIMLIENHQFLVIGPFSLREPYKNLMISPGIFHVMVLNEDLFLFSNHQSNFRKWLDSFWMARKKYFFVEKQFSASLFWKKSKGKNIAEKLCFHNRLLKFDRWGCSLCRSLGFVILMAVFSTLHIFPRHVDFSC